MTALVQFQHAFAAALHDEASDFALAAQPAFAIYRNTVMRACLDALEANFPAVACLVGRDWFRAAAAIYVGKEPPRDARLALYGDAFPDFLAHFEPAARLPYLADVARLDRLCSESANAADASPLDLGRLAELSPEWLAKQRLRLHPATRWIDAAVPVLTIWEASRRGEPVGSDLRWVAQQALVVRVADHVHVVPSDVASLAMLDAIARGATLGDAATVTTSAHPGARLDLTLPGLLRSGAFAQS